MSDQDETVMPTDDALNDSVPAEEVPTSESMWTPSSASDESDRDEAYLAEAMAFETFDTFELSEITDSVGTEADAETPLFEVTDNLSIVESSELSDTEASDEEAMLEEIVDLPESADVAVWAEDERELSAAITDTAAHDESEVQREIAVEDPVAPILGSEPQRAMEAFAPVPVPPPTLGGRLRALFSPLSGRLAAIDASIEADPAEPMNYLRRGELRLTGGRPADQEAAALDFYYAAAIAEAIFEDDDWGINAQMIRDRALANLKTLAARGIMVVSTESN